LRVKETVKNHMKIEKKLILSGILAIAIGIASIAPLAFFMSASAQTSPDKSVFDLQVPYAYWTANYSTNSNGTVTYTESNALGIHYSINADAAHQVADTRIEYYQFHAYSDQGTLADWTYYIAARRSNSSDFSSFTFTESKGFSSNTTSGGLILSGFEDNDTSPSLTAMFGSSSGIYGSNAWETSTIKQLISGIQDANVLYVDVSRLGYVTFNGNTTTVTHADNGVIQHIEMTRYGDGFLYNTIIPQNQLAQTDLIHPAFSQNP
jgi:hypothetical protein